jgi:TctA family transporter
MANVTISKGKQFRDAVAASQASGMPLLLPGVPTAYCALLAKNAGM